MQRAPLLLSFLVLSFLVLPLLASPAVAQWSSDPALNQPLMTAGGQQNQVKLAPTSDRGLWVSAFDGGAGWDVRLQRLDANGVELFPGDGVLVADRGFSSTQDYGLDVGRFGSALLAFRDDRVGGTQITAARIDLDGNAEWGALGVQLTATNDFVAAPKIAGLQDGSSVVAWTQNAGIVLQRLDLSGAPLWGAGISFTPGAGSYSVSDLHDAGNEVIVSFVHQTGGFGSPRHILAQKLDTNGSSLWGASHVAVFDGGSLQFGNFPGFVPDAAGGGVFAWYDTSSTQFQCFVQRISSAGSEAFPHNGVPVSTDATRTRVSPDVAFDPSSQETFVAWREQNSGQSMFGVYAQKLDAAGARQWTDAGTEVVALSGTERSQVRTRPAAGGAFVFWDESPSFGQDRILGARLDASGAVDLASFDVASTPSGKSRLALASTNYGLGVLAWSDDRSDGGDILVQNVGAGGGLGEIEVGTPYCFGAGCPCANDDPRGGCAHVAGRGARIAGLGSTSVAANDLLLNISAGRPLGTGLFFYGPNNIQATFGNGQRCVGGATYRLFPLVQVDAGGAVARQVDLSSPPQPGGQIQSGSTWYFQLWYRDPNPSCVSSFNMSNGLALTFVP